ncbi:hypothetical protein SAMN05444272_3654 [Roseibium suaedae]|uniref:Uncharacterized protein n=1 Tax=Roseibium suaedae TaxID=735517 RepID=A0A1M7N1D4_9HYPH|nr:hypothetical protein SAMN05444272_3654 [Roseibium suaedae]
MSYVMAFLSVLVFSALRAHGTWRRKQEARVAIARNSAGRPRSH